jgi:hypothetical protein
VLLGVDNSSPFRNQLAIENTFVGRTVGRRQQEQQQVELEPGPFHSWIASEATHKSQHLNCALFSVPVAGRQDYYILRIVAGQGQGQGMGLEPVGLGTDSASALELVLLVEQEDIVLHMDLVLLELVAPTRLAVAGFLAIAAAVDNPEKGTVEDTVVEQG